MRVPAGAGFLAGLLVLTSCSTSNVRQSGPSPAAYFSGNEASPTPEEAQRELSRELTQSHVRVAAQLQTGPSLRGMHIRQGMKEGLSVEAIEQRIQDLSHRWVEDHTAFRLTIVGRSREDIDFGHWKVVLVDSKEQTYPVDLIPDVEKSERLYERTGYAVASHIDITKPLELRLVNRSRPSLAPFNLRWSIEKPASKR